MDNIDHLILDTLKENSRASTADISRRVRLSPPAVGERIRKLEEAGVIEQYTVRLNRQKIGMGLLAFVMVTITTTEEIPRFRQAAVGWGCVLECHHIAGEYDYLLKVLVKDTAALEDFLTNTLKPLGCVAKSNTVIALSTLKEAVNV